MKPKPSKRFWPTIGLASVSGMRTTAAVSALSSYLVSAPSPLLNGFPFGFLQKKYVSFILKALVLAELAADKSPAAPNRIEKEGLIARGFAGAFTGAALYKSRNGSAFAGAFFGGTAAVAATYGSFYLRKKVVESTGINDPAVGGLEDIIALQTASLAL